MCRTITLSLLKGVEENVSGLLSYLHAAKASCQTASPPPADALDVLLECPTASFDRACLITHIQRLYDATAEFDCKAMVNIVPMLRDTASTSSSSSPLPLLRPITKGDMVAAAGYDPVYSYVAVGGTFDRLHAGHKLLLSISALHSLDKLRVGITGPELLAKKKHAELLQSFDVRRSQVVSFLRKLRQPDDLELEIEPIHEFSGGTDRIAEIQALCASPETLPAIPKINALRRERNLPDIVPIPIYYVGGSEPSVSSSKLRALEVERKE